MVAAAERAGVAPGEFCRRMLIETRLEAGCVTARPDEGPEGEESVRRVLRHPSHTGGSDGIYVGGHPHPRGFGAFARLLGRHVRELGDWTWEQAAVHLASHPARRFGLGGPRSAPAGFAADVVVLDPVTVADRATYDASAHAGHAGWTTCWCPGCPCWPAGARPAPDTRGTGASGPR